MLKAQRKANLDDGCNPELVAGAQFDGILEIPIIKAPSKIVIPKGITPFSERDRIPGPGEALGFFEKDPKFADVLIHPKFYVDEFRKIGTIISIDCSLYRSAPLAVQIENLYRNRAIGSFYQRKGVNVIPLIRWGNEYTYTTKYFPERIAFLGAEKNSIVCIGTYGCIDDKENKYYFQAGLEAMLETLTPKVVLVYGSMPKSVFSNYLNDAKFVQYPDWTKRMHGGDC